MLVRSAFCFGRACFHILPRPHSLSLLSHQCLRSAASALAVGEPGVQRDGPPSSTTAGQPANQTGPAFSGWVGQSLSGVGGTQQGWL